MAKDLRTHLANLEARGRLLEVDRPVDPVSQMSNLIYQAWNGYHQTVLFKEVRGYPGWQSVGALFCSREDIAHCFGVTKQQLAKYLGDLVEERGLTPCRPVSDGPVQANRFSGDQVNLEA